MSPLPILSVIHIVATGTMQDFNGGNEGHGLKTLRVNRPLHTTEVYMETATLHWIPNMAYLDLHCWALNWILTPNLMATLYCTETLSIAQTQIPIWIWIPCDYCSHFGTDIRIRIGIRICVGKANKPLQLKFMCKLI